MDPIKASKWMYSGDTGISSKTIFEFMTGMPVWSIPDVPHDPSDFGRCYRLLQMFPEWVHRLPDMVNRYPFWEPFIREWWEMFRLYDRDLKSGRSADLFALMQKLEKESWAIKGGKVIHPSTDEIKNSKRSQNVG